MSFEEVKQRALYLRTENRDRDFRDCARQAMSEMLSPTEVVKLSTLFDTTINDLEDSICKYLENEIRGE